MQKYHFLILGGGIIGLATARELLLQFPKAKIALLEKENELCKHQTGHNSGVIHSGIYYRPGSLKAQTCVSGVKKIKDFAKQYKIPMKETGKVIVATTPLELFELNRLLQRGKQNGVPGVQLICANQLRQIEPYVQGAQALWVPSTAIIDFKMVCKKFREIICANGGKIYLGEKALSIHNRFHSMLVKTENTVFSCDYLINCCGLYSDITAKMTGIVPKVQIVPFRGEYYKLIPEKEHMVKGLIYPVPNPAFPFLGVHFTKMVDGAVKAGPNAVLALKREGYKKSDFSWNETWQTLSFPGFWRLASRHWKYGMGEVARSFSKKLFLHSLKRLIPTIVENDIVKYRAGVRAQALDPSGKLVDDFRVEMDARALHVLNAPSPAATASISIAEKIVEMAKIKWSIEYR